MIFGPVDCRMKTATTQELRQGLARILSWIEQGEEVQITRRGQVLARLVPPAPLRQAPAPAPAAERKLKMPGFENSMRKLFGDE
jgi:antitoxin (DNA-binding transcriptional repressor) of toxin-antitoxin stability system